jgi:trehalose 6-phosphate phosphatase
VSPHAHTAAVGLEQALATASAVLAATPAALITDIDGTLSPIVARPEDATVDPAICRSLEQLAERVSLVAIVTARDAAAAHRMIEARNVTYVTHYGLTDNLGPLAGDGLEAAKQRARSVAAPIAGVTVEEKGLSLAVHYRNTSDPEAVRARLLADLAPIAATAGARLLEGKRVVEIVPATLPSKAQAVAEITQNAGARGVIYLGDDVSDVPVFDYLTRRRDEAGQPGLAIAVVDLETHPSVLAGADLALDGVEAVARFLAGLVGALEKGVRS